MTPDSIQLAASALFGLAILHTFSVKRFQHLARKYPEGSAGENFFHLLGEVEVVFGIWAAIFLAYLTFAAGKHEAIRYAESRNFTEPAFVFVIMTVCSTRPILELASRAIELASRLLPLKRPVAFYATTLTIGPLLGSLITEPAAMTVTALILLDRFYAKGISDRLKYATIGLLFVNVSIGGTLTPFAAPPVLMVAGKWDWNLVFMLTQFGWKGALAAAVSTAVVAYRFRKELGKLPAREAKPRKRLPLWVGLSHLVFLFAIVYFNHHLVIFSGVFLFFLGLFSVSREHQDDLKLREGLLVAFFLGGLVVLGGQQSWWLEPLLARLEALPLYLGAMGLTAVTDNAALTYLGAQVPTITEASKYALVAGAVVGGGLTVIANAPNPAGQALLGRFFAGAVSPLGLLAGAIVPTLIAAAVFRLF